jgi:hypothetical protein
MDMFGYFTVDRFGYDRAYGVVAIVGTLRRADLSAPHADPPVVCHSTDTTPAGASPHRDDDANGTEDECESIGRGSRCDDVVGLCTIPLRDRSLRSIPWHVSQGFPDEYFEDTRAALAAWSDAMRVAVVAGRLVECERTGEADCRTTLGWPERWADDWRPPVGSSAPGEVPDLRALYQPGRSG